MKVGQTSDLSELFHSYVSLLMCFCLGCISVENFGFLISSPFFWKIKISHSFFAIRSGDLSITNVIILKDDDTYQNVMKNSSRNLFVNHRWRIWTNLFRCCYKTRINSFSLKRFRFSKVFNFGREVQVSTPS